MTETKVRNLLTHRYLTQRSHAGLTVVLAWVPAWQANCVLASNFMRASSASVQQNLFDQICSGEVSLASSRKSINHVVRSLRPTNTTSP
jgi:hypothetical protein